MSPVTRKRKRRANLRAVQAARKSRAEARKLRAMMPKPPPKLKAAKLPTLRFSFRGIEDDYRLGIVCYHTGLTETARCQLRGMGEGERARLFLMGLRDAKRGTLADVAAELSMLRRRQPALFDALVQARIGQERHAAIVEAAKSYKPNHSRRGNFIRDALATLAAASDREGVTQYAVRTGGGEG